VRWKRASSVHLGRLGVGVPALDAALLKELGEVGFESLPLSDSTAVGRWGSRDRPESRARAVYRACLEGSPTAKAKCETGSMKVTR